MIDGAELTRKGNSDRFKWEAIKWSIILPVSNEEEILFEAVSSIIGEFRRLDEPFELLICENGSMDRSLEIARQLEKSFDEVRVLVYGRPSYGRALKMGIEEARGKWLIVFNVDFWDMDFVKRAMERLLDWELVLGSKLIHGSEDQRPPFRRMITKSFNLFLKVTTGLRSTDTHGMKVMCRERIVPVSRKCVTEGWTFDTELVIRAEWAGIRTGELPVTVKEIRPPRHGLLRRIPKTIFSIFKMLYFLRRDLPLKNPAIGAGGKAREEGVTIHQSSIPQGYNKSNRGGCGIFSPKSDPKAYYYDTIASEFDSMMNLYDLRKRLTIVFDRFLHGYPILGKSVLDLGCGTGSFSRLAMERGGKVFSLDIGMGLLVETGKKCRSISIQGDALMLPFKSGAFDLIICSELIEHTSSPKQAIKECARAIRGKGLLVITVPNRIWYGAFRIYRLLGIRPYKGYENWVGWFELRRWLKEEGLEIRWHIGFHAIPFISPRIYPVIDLLDRFLSPLGPLMVNMGVVARKA